MANFYTDNDDIRFLFRHTDVAGSADVCEEGFKFAGECFQRGEFMTLANRGFVLMGLNRGLDRLLEIVERHQQINPFRWQGYQS